MAPRTAQVLRQVRPATLDQLEERFGRWVPPTLFPKAARNANSRDRVYTRWRTFWALVWQGFNPQSTGR